MTTWGELDASWHDAEVLVWDPSWPHQAFAPVRGRVSLPRDGVVPVLVDGDVVHSFAGWAAVQRLDRLPCRNAIVGVYRCTRPRFHRGQCEIQLDDENNP